MKKYKVILHQEYIVEAETKQAAISKAEQLGLGDEYEIGLDTVVEELADAEEDKVVFKLDKEKIAREDLQQPNFLLTYCKNIEKDYEVNVDLVYDEKEDCYSEVIITGSSRNIISVVYDGMFEDLVDLTNGTTEQIYDEQHGQKYYGPWDL